MTDTDAASGERRDGRGGKSGQCTIGPVRGLVLAVVGAFGLMAWWRKRRHTDETPPVDLEPDPADELRAKLAESRAADEDDDEPAPSEPEGSPLDPQSRRQDIHERARASMDDLA